MLECSKVDAIHDEDTFNLFDCIKWRYQLLQIVFTLNRSQIVLDTFWVKYILKVNCFYHLRNIFHTSHWLSFHKKIRKGLFITSLFNQILLNLFSWYVNLAFEFVFLAILECWVKCIDLFSQILVILVVKFDVIILYSTIIENIGGSAALNINRLSKEEHWVLFNQILYVHLDGLFIHGLSCPYLDTILSSDTNNLPIELIIEKNGHR